MGGVGGFRHNHDRVREGRPQGAADRTGSEVRGCDCAPLAGLCRQDRHARSHRRAVPAGSAAVTHGAYFASNSAARVCQPLPEARQRARAVSSMRSAMATFFGAFCGPRLPRSRRSSTSVAATPPPCVLMASLQSSVWPVASGAAAIAAAFIASVRQGIEVFASLVFVGMAARKYMRPGVALSPQQNDHPVVPPGQTF